MGQVRAHDFAAVDVPEGGYERIEAVKALDEAIRMAQAEQMAQVATLHAERSSIMRLGDGDPGVSMAGEVGMARGKNGLVPESVDRAAVHGTDTLDADDRIVADADLSRILPGPGPGPVRAGRAAAKVDIEPDAEAVREPGPTSPSNVSASPKESSWTRVRMASVVPLAIESLPLGDESARQSRHDRGGDCSCDWSRLQGRIALNLAERPLVSLARLNQC